MTKIINFPSSSCKRTIIKSKSKICFKNKLKSRSMPSLCSLPNEVLEQIIDNVNIWHWSHIRNTCTRLRDVCDSKLKHDFRKSLFRFSCVNSDGEDYAMIRLIDDMTYVYVNTGFESTFLGTLLSLLQSNYKSPYVLLIKRIRLFLRSFYCLVDEKLKPRSEQRSNLLFTLTLFSILKKCKNCVIASSKNLNNSNWNVAFELKGSWFGVLYSSGHFQAETYDFTYDRHDILIILAEVLLANHTKNNYKKVWEGSKKVILCGHEPTRKHNVPKTIYQININGTYTLIQCISNFYFNQGIDWSSLPKDEFDVNGKITCKEATKWGCCSNYFFNIGSNYDEENKNIFQINKDSFANVETL